MHFMLAHGWSCQFLEADLKTSAGRRLTFADAAKVREMFDRFACNKQLEDREAVEHGIEAGRGAIWIELTDEQYRKLKQLNERRGDRQEAFLALWKLDELTACDGGMDLARGFLLKAGEAVDKLDQAEVIALRNGLIRVGEFSIFLTRGTRGRL
jgi:hypothetical protein